MPHWTWKVGEAGAAILRIDGEATVETVDELQTLLREGMEAYERLEIDCTGTTAADFYTIQLLCSAHRTAMGRNKAFAFHGPPSEAVRQTVQMVGFARSEGCRICPGNAGCLWV